MRIGILGCGNIIGGHVERLKERQAVEIVALCDVNNKAIIRVKEQFFAERSIALYQSANSMYEEQSLDAVVIATPHTLHYEHAMQAMDAGCHVFLENRWLRRQNRRINLQIKRKNSTE